MKLNDVNVSDFNCKKVAELLSAVPPGGSVVLLIQGPEGYTTYLHTGKPCFIIAKNVKTSLKKHERLYPLIETSLGHCSSKIVPFWESSKKHR